MTFQKGHTIFKGRKHSEETRAKISEANKGRVFSDEWRENLSKAHKGQVSWRKGKKFVPDEVQKARRQEYIKGWREENKEKLREQGRIWKANNRERVATNARLRYQKDPQANLDYKRLKKYGITGEEFRNRVLEQNHLCPICERSIDKNFSVDHDHVTGKVRGIICNNCNLAIGNAMDSPERLRAMADYLEKAK